MIIWGIFAKIAIEMIDTSSPLPNSLYLKVLNHALTGTDAFSFANCNKFVDVLGLRTIFPLFMKTPKKQRRKGKKIYISG